jgi:hypothetical protein
MNRIQSQEILGDIAETVVYDYFETQGNVVEMSTDPYDQEKDMLINSVRTEVKFETLYHKFNSFSIPVFNTRTGKISKNQLNKCMNVERLIVVQNPSKNKIVTLWEAAPLGKRDFSFHTNQHDGRLVALFPLESFTKIVDICSDKLYNEITKYSFSNYKEYA